MTLLKKTNLILTGCMVGLIWVIQLVHYPSFAYVDPAQFKIFHEHHTYYIGIIAAPLMVIELVLAVYLFLKNKTYVFPLLIVLLIWASTFLVQVPLHQLLENNMDQKAIDQLINSNWLRTFLWTFKAIMLLSFEIGNKE